MEEREILKSVTDTLTGKRIFEITVPVKWRPKYVAPPLPKYTLLDWILRRKRPQPEPEPAQETHRTFEMWPCVVANQYRIAGNAALLTDQMSDNHSDNIQLIIDNQPLVVYIVASAIQNNHLEPDPELVEFITNNFDHEDLYTSLRAAFSNMGMQSFSNSIALLKGTVKILKPDQEASPVDGKELIASHIQTLVQSANTSDGQSGM